MSVLDFFTNSGVILRAENSALKTRLRQVEQRLFAEMTHSRKLTEDRNALLAQNCRLRAQRDDARAQRRDASGRFSR